MFSPVVSFEVDADHVAHRTAAAAVTPNDEPRRLVGQGRAVPMVDGRYSLSDISGARARPAGLAGAGDGNIVAATTATREAPMPTYDYGCEHCGRFTEAHPMAEFARPQPCPNCGAPAPRALTSPAIGGAARDAPFAAHPGGCRCCAAPGRFCAEAV